MQQNIICPCFTFCFPLYVFIYIIIPAVIPYVKSSIWAAGADADVAPRNNNITIGIFLIDG